jgi:hypothetical protein
VIAKGDYTIVFAYLTDRMFQRSVLVQRKAAERRGSLQDFRTQLEPAMIATSIPADHVAEDDGFAMRGYRY